MRHLRRLTLPAGLVLALSSTHALAAANVIVGHFAPFDDELAATAVDVRVNGTVALTGVRYGSFTEYLPLAPGQTLVEILPTGTTTVAISTTLTLVDNQSYTVLAVGGANAQPLALQALQDDRAAPAAGNVKVRVVHAAPFASTTDATRVSVRTDRGQVVGGLADVPFFAASPYLELPAGSYDLKIATPDGARNLIDIAPAALPAGAILTVVARGDGSLQPLGVTAIPLGPLPSEKAVDISVSGHWYTPEFSGQGFAFTPKPNENRLLGTWYTWNADGTQRWYVLDSAGEQSGAGAAQGGFDNDRAVFTVSTASGGRFAASNPVQTTPVGTLTVDFEDCDTAVAVYSLSGGVTGTLPLTNLTPSGTCSL